MAEMTPDQRKEMLSDPGFWDKPEKDQIAALSAASSKFKGAPPNVQLGTLQALHASIQHPGVNPKPAIPPAPSKTPSIGTAIEKGMYEGPAQLDRFAANALGMMGLTRASEYYRKRQEASQAAASKLPESQTVGQSIAEAVPSMIGQIPALATRSPLGFAAVGAVQRADEGVGGALEGAAENYGMAKMFPVVGRAGEKILSKVPGVPSAAAKMLGRPLAVGAIPGFIDYISGKPLHQAIGDAATMAAISVFHGNSREAKESAKAAAASAEKVPQPQVTEEIEGRPVERQNPELVKRVQEARAKKGVPSAEPFVKPKTIEEAEQQLNSAIQRQVQMEEAGQDTSSLQKNIVRLQAFLEDPELMADWAKRHPGTTPPKENSPKGQELIPTTPERKASRLAAAKDRAKTPVVVPGLGQRVAPEEVGEFPDQMKPKERLIRPPEEERNPKSSIPKGTVDTTKVQILKANGSEPGTLPFRDTPDNMVNKGWIRLIGDGKYITLKKLPGMPEGTRFRFGTIAPPPPTTPKALPPPTPVKAPTESKAASNPVPAPTAPPGPPEPATGSVTPSTPISALGSDLKDEFERVRAENDRLKAAKEEKKPTRKKVVVEPKAAEPPKPAKPAPVKPPLAAKDEAPKPKPAEPPPAPAATGWASLPEEAKTGIARSTLEAIGVKPEKEALSDAIAGIDDLVKEGRSITEALQELGLEDEQIAKIVGGGSPEPKAEKPPGPSAKETEPSNVGREDLDRVTFRNKVNSYISQAIRPEGEGRSSWDNVQVKMTGLRGEPVGEVSIPADQFTEEGLWDILVNNPNAHMIQLTDPGNRSAGRFFWALESAMPNPPGPSRTTGAK